MRLVSQMLGQDMRTVSVCKPERDRAAIINDLIAVFDGLRRREGNSWKTSGALRELHPLASRYVGAPGFCMPPCGIGSKCRRRQPAQPVFVASDSAFPRAWIAHNASLICPNQPAPSS